MNKPKFNINDYPGKYVMHCDSIDKAIVFCKYMASVGKLWDNGSTYLDNNYYSIFCHNTVYEFNCGKILNYVLIKGDCNYFILEFDDFCWDEGEEKKNYIEQFAEMLGVEVGEEFNIINRYGDLFISSPHKLTEDGFVDREGHSTFKLSGHVISGDCTIQKLPWKPENGENYFFVDINRKIGSVAFNFYNFYDLIMYSFGNCFRTKEEALKNIDKIVEKLKGIQEELK